MAEKEAAAEVSSSARPMMHVGTNHKMFINGTRTFACSCGSCSPFVE
jgi:hypothetical protein